MATSDVGLLNVKYSFSNDTSKCTYKYDHEGVKLLQKQNFSSLNIDEVCAQADLSKGAFYHHFKSKDDFNDQATKYYVNQMMTTIQEDYITDIDPLQRVYYFVEKFKVLTNQGMLSEGCLVGNSSQEISKFNENIKMKNKEYFETWMEAMIFDINESITKHKPTLSINSRNLAQMFVALLQGSILMDKVYMDKSLINENINLYKKFIEMLFHNGGLKP